MQCLVSRHSWQLSRDIVDTSLRRGGRPCRRRSLSSPPSCWRDAAKARSPVTTTSRVTGCSNWSNATRPRARRRSNHTRAAPTTIPARSAPRSKTRSCGCAKLWTSRATTLARPPSPNTSPAIAPSSKFLQCPRSGASCPAEASWSPSPKSPRSAWKRFQADHQ